MINKEFFDNAEWENESPRNLCKLIDGWSVADGEPVIDGIKDEKIKSIILYMQKNDKEYKYTIKRVRRSESNSAGYTSVDTDTVKIDILPERFPKGKINSQRFPIGKKWD